MKIISNNDLYDDIYNFINSLNNNEILLINMIIESILLERGIIILN